MIEDRENTKSIFDTDGEPEVNGNDTYRQNNDTRDAIDRVLQRLDDSFYTEDHHRELWKKLDEMSKSGEDGEDIKYLSKRQQKKLKREKQKKDKEKKIEALAEKELIYLTQREANRVAAENEVNDEADDVREYVIGGHSQTDDEAAPEYGESHYSDSADEDSTADNSEENSFAAEHKENPQSVQPELISWRQYIRSRIALRQSSIEQPIPAEFARVSPSVIGIISRDDAEPLSAEAASNYPALEVTDDLKNKARKMAIQQLKQEAKKRRQNERRANYFAVKNSLKGLPDAAKALLWGILLLAVAGAVTLGVLAKTEFFVISDIVEKRNETSKSYQQLLADKSDAELELDSLIQQSDELQLEISSYEDVIADAQDYEQNVDYYNAQIEQLENQKSEMEKNLSEKQKQLDEVMNKIKMYENQLVEAQGKGYTLSAGVYFADKEIPSGYYNIDLVSGNGGVYVKASDGAIMMGELFGTRSDNYITGYKNAYVGAGGYIEISGSTVVKFTARE